jgi:hypothetical protein
MKVVEDVMMFMPISMWHHHASTSRLSRELSLAHDPFGPSIREDADTIHVPHKYVFVAIYAAPAL